MGVEGVRSIEVGGDGGFQSPVDRGSFSGVSYDIFHSSTCTSQLACSGFTFLTCSSHIRSLVQYNRC